MARNKQYDSQLVDLSKKKMASSLFTAGLVEYFTLDIDFQNYRTSNGDTIANLAERFGITVEDIRKLNENELLVFGDDELLTEDLVLKLPSFATNVPLFTEVQDVTDVNDPLLKEEVLEPSVNTGNSSSAVTGGTINQENTQGAVINETTTTGTTTETTTATTTGNTTGDNIVSPTQNTTVSADQQSNTTNTEIQTIVLPDVRSGIYVDKPLTSQQKIDFHWNVLWADFKKEFAGTYPKHTDWIIACWIRKCLIDGWKYGEPIPNIHNEKEVGEKEFGKDMVIVISSFSFSDAFAYAWRKYGEGKPFWWYDEKTGKYSYHTVYFGSEGMQYNYNNHTYDVGLIDKLYHVSGDVTLRDSAIAEKKIGEEFTKLVLDAQKVLYLDDQTKWTGKLDPDTQAEMEKFLLLSAEEQDVQRVTAHYLLMMGANDDLRVEVWQAYDKQPGMKELFYTSTMLLMQPEYERKDQIQTTTLGSLGGYSSVNGQEYLKRNGEEEQAQQDRKDEGARLWNQYMYGLQQAFLASGVTTDDQVLENAMAKYSIVMRENGAVQTIHIGGGNKYVDLSSGVMGTSTYVYNTGIVVPETITVNYKENLKENVLKNVEERKEAKMQEGINTQLSELPKSSEDINQAFDHANLTYMKQGAELLGGELQELYNDWVTIQLRILALTAAEKENPPADLTSMITLFHSRMLGIASRSTDSYMGHVTNPYYPAELGGGPILPPFGTPPAPGSFAESNSTFTGDTFVLQQMMRERLLKSPDAANQRLGKEWESSRQMSHAVSRYIWGDKEHSWTRLPVSFFADENLHDQLMTIDPTAAAKVESSGVPLQMYWDLDDEGNYVVRLILNPEEDPITVTGSTLEEALNKLNTQKVLPKGVLYYSHNGETNSIATEGGMLLSTKLGLASLAFLVAGAILTPFTGGGSMVVATMMVTSATIGVVASGVSMYEHSETGRLTNDVIALETLNIAANILGGVGSLTKVKNLAALKGLAFAKNVYYVEMSGAVLKTAAATNIIVFTDNVLTQLQDINENIPEGPERDEAIKRVIEFAVLMGFVMVISSTAGEEEAPKSNTNTGTKITQNAGAEGPVVETAPVKTVTGTTLETETTVVNTVPDSNIWITKTGERTVNLDIEIKKPEGGTEMRKVTGELKDGEWTYKMADDSPMPPEVEAQLKSPTVKNISGQVLNGEIVAGQGGAKTETIKTGTEILPAAMDNKPPADLLSPYPQMRDQLPGIQAKVGNMKYYKFENYLRELPENVKVELDNRPELVDPLSKKFLTDPVWANKVKAGNAAMLDELRVKIDGKMYKPEGADFYTDDAGTYYKKNTETGKLDISSKEAFDNFKIALVKAKELINNISIIEPQITETVSNLAQQNGGRMEGLEFRLKSAESLQRKLLTDGIDNPVNDVLRYTIILDTDFTNGTKSVMEGLQAAGYETIIVKNTFKDGAVYKGINTNVKAPNGQVFEIQYHTSESFNVKQNINHTLYEEYRLLDPNSPEAIELKEQMITNSNSIAPPQDVETIKDIR